MILADKGSKKVTRLKIKLQNHESCVKSSGLYSHAVSLLEPLKFTRIRCLALGSPTQEFQALYQLAFLNLIVSHFGVLPENVSLYDPAFTSEDIQLLENELKYTVMGPDNGTNVPETTKSTLFYMPHAPRSLTESILRHSEPLWFLANDFSVTMGTLTKAKFLEQYPLLASLVNLHEKSGHKSKILENDGFTPVKRKRNRARKIVYVEPDLDYGSVETYFSGIQINRIQADDEAPWKDSFSDLALNVVEIAHKAEEKSIS